MYRSFFAVLSFLCLNTAFSQPKTDAFLENILSSAKNAALDTVLKHPQDFRCQIIYTQINRDKNNKPTFQPYYFNYDQDLYFNPASTVKLPLTLLALEKLQALRSYGIDKYTPMQFDSSYKGQKALYSDSTSENTLPSIAHFIRRAFLISENDPYNRLYQFVGQKTINEKLHEKGYMDARITRQFMGFSEEQNRHTNSVRFIKEDGSLLYQQPPAYNQDSFNFERVVKIGKAYLNKDDSLVNEPFDFTRHNNLSLSDLQQLLQSALFPVSMPAKKRFQLSKDDYAFVQRYLSQYPSETLYPKYDDSIFYDSYVKFFFRDSTHKMPAHIRVFNKVGWAYGFMTDVSYVVDFKNKIEFMLAATVYVNRDEVLNDNKYEYETIAHPFLYALGQAIYRYELQRSRKHRPDLSAFHISYEQRDPSDKRPVIKIADN